MSNHPSDTPIYETVVRLWQAHGRAVPGPPPARPARPSRGWVRVDPAPHPGR
ncbi:hypothetical protein [Streptomyces sp. NPDC088785]|uniref:hypothetical protein n=1 Tax=Streptomyces sp. NPDC088785 TaxID=3365897 RepID=UPI0037F21155